MLDLGLMSLDGSAIPNFRHVIDAVQPHPEVKAPGAPLNLDSNMLKPMNVILYSSISQRADQLHGYTSNSAVVRYIGGRWPREDRLAGIMNDPVDPSEQPDTVICVSDLFKRDLTDGMVRIYRCRRLT
jgi:hypothetical protein